MNQELTIARLQRGVSLIELMVAMSIGIFLLAGAVTVFGKTRDLYRTNDAAARLQETARYAVGTMEADLRLANYWGLHSRADLVENGPALDPLNIPDVDPAYALPADLTAFAGTINSCGNMWAVKLPAYAEGNNNAYGYNCAAFGAAVAGSDQLTVRRSSTQVIAAAGLAASAGQIKLQTSRVAGTLFSGGALPAGYSPPLSETRAIVVHGYYVDQDSDQLAGTPSLRRKQLAFAGGAPVIQDQEIVPGVEDLQVEFGVDQNTDQNADYFVPPGTAMAAGREIVAVRVWLLVRAEQPEFTFTDDRTYSYADRVGAAAYTPGDNFRRVLVSKTMALRNTRR
ncbi:MAG: PilW family protein [Dongiaceae bacterium]